MHRLAPILCALAVLGLVAGCTSGSTGSKLTAEEDAYLDALDAQMDALSDSVERFAGLMQVTTSGTAWAAGIEEEAGLWAGLYRDGRELVPPARFAELNAENLAMLELLVDAGRDLIVAARRTDPLALGDGLDKFWRARDMAAEVKHEAKEAR